MEGFITSLPCGKGCSGACWGTKDILFRELWSGRLVQAAGGVLVVGLKGRCALTGASAPVDGPVR